MTNSPGLPYIRNTNMRQYEHVATRRGEQIKREHHETLHFGHHGQEKLG